MTSKSKAIFRYLLLLPLALVVLSVIVLWQFLPVASDSANNSVRFVIPSGQAVSIIASRLEDAGLVRNQYAFRLVLKVSGYEDDLQAGSFLLAPYMSQQEIAFELTQGTNDIWVTLPEGWRREEIAAALSEYDLPAFNEDEFLVLTAGEEGLLFPDTYLFSRESTATTIHSVLINTFEQKVMVGLADELDASSYDLNQVLTMASIVERESRGYEEMRQVAGILWNRFQIDMALQADATLQYVTGYDSTTASWWSPPTSADKSIESPYNTYHTAGLPPQPIANPGLEAIRATLNPAENSYLFYLHDREGGIHYARSLEEHNANVQRYLR